MVSNSFSNDMIAKGLFFRIKMHTMLSDFFFFFRLEFIFFWETLFIIKIVKNGKSLFMVEGVNSKLERD